MKFCGSVLRGRESNGGFMDYSSLSDEELVSLSKSDEGAENFLLLRHKPLVLKFARSLYLTCGDREDLIQEGMIGLFHAIHRYQEDSGIRFVTFAHTCVRNQMLKAVEKGTRKKDIPPEYLISLDDETFREEAWHVTSLGNPEKIVIERENGELLLGKLRDRLSPLEREVLFRYLDGKSYRDIAGELGRTPKSIENALGRIRGKLRDIHAAK